jgi:hypothetical protein
MTISLSLSLDLDLDLAKQQINFLFPFLSLLLCRDWGRDTTIESKSVQISVQTNIDAKKASGPKKRKTLQQQQQQ